MAETKAATTAKKAERKKPVRTAPVQKDYPNKLAWLKAMTEHEEREAAAVNKAKVERLDKRIAVKTEALRELGAELDKLKLERQALVPAETEDEGFDEFEIANGRDEDPA